LGAVDTAVVGHLPDPAFIGAVAIGAMIFSYLYWGFGFLRMGTTGFAAQAFGAEDAHEIQACLGRALIVGGGLSILVLSTQSLTSTLAFNVLEGSEAVESHARTYFDIRIWGAPAALANYVLLGWLLGLQKPKTALFLQILMNGLNIVLDLVFVLVLGMEVAGVAAATVIAEYSAVGVGFLLVLKHLRMLKIRVGWDQLLNRAKLMALVGVNANIFVRTVCLLVAFSSFTALGAKSGDVILAANAVLMNMLSMIAHGLDGFAHAAEALTGSAIGRRSRKLFSQTVKISTFWAFATAILLTVITWAMGPLIISLLTGIEEVRKTAFVYLPWVIATPLMSVWCYQLDGIFIGATRTAAMRNASLASLALYGVALWVLLPMFDNHGLWAAISIFNVARAVTLCVGLSAIYYSFRDNR